MFGYALSWWPIIVLCLVPAGIIYDPQTQDLQCCCERNLPYGNPKLRLSTVSFFSSTETAQPCIKFLIPFISDNKHFRLFVFLRDITQQKS